MRPLRQSATKSYSPELIRGSLPRIQQRQLLGHHRQAERAMRLAYGCSGPRPRRTEADQGLDAKSARPGCALRACGFGLRLTVRHISAIQRALRHTAPTGLRIDPASQGCRHVCRDTSGGVTPEDHEQRGTHVTTVLSAAHRLRCAVSARALAAWRLALSASRVG